MEVQRLHILKDFFCNKNIMQAMFNGKSALSEATAGEPSLASPLQLSRL